MRLLFLLLICLSVGPALAEPDLQKVAADLDPYIEASRREWQVPGMAVALVADGKVYWSKGYGVRKLGTDEPVTPETVFQIGSISKSFTSTLVAMEVDDGKLDWDDRVIDHFPEFRMFDPWVTRECRVEDTMAQRSGQAAYVADGLYILGRDREQILKAMRDVQPVSSFRSEFAYVNNIWLVTAKVLESVAGQSWEEQVETRIFRPLGMTSSSTDLRGLTSAANRAAPHHWTTQGTVVGSDASCEWAYTAGPAGGINSNVLDMGKYLALQMGHHQDLISEESLDRVHQPHTPIIGSRPVGDSGVVVESTNYCLGWVRQERTPYPIVWHNGGTDGYRAVAGFVPEKDFGLVVLSNTADSDLAEAIMMRYYDLYFGLPETDYSSIALAGWKKTLPTPKKRPASPRPHASLSEYEGRFQNIVYGEAEVRESEGRLQVRMEGGRISFFLRPWNGDVFAYDDPFEPGTGAVDFATFVPDSSGEFQELRLGAFEDIDDGKFTRSSR